MNVVTRYPPSPTGKLHLGSLRTALFNYLFAKKHGGKMILRFEDTDKARSKKEFEQDIFEGLEWLGIKSSEVYHQSERTLVYKKHLEKLLADGTAYLSETSNVSELNQGGEDDFEEIGAGEIPARVIRFKNPKKVVVFKDEVRGEISVGTAELGDFIIARSLEEPLYHFAVVVDDFEMGVTHCIRGEDGIYNTPRQILIQEVLGAPRPVYCHIPFVLGNDRTKLSKRHGSVSVDEYRKTGFLPGAMLNYLALLGWNPGTPQEIFTFEELVAAFDFSGLQKSGAIFDEEKLRWINREHLRRLPEAELKKLAVEHLPKSFQELPQWNDERLTKTLPEFRERITVTKDITDLAEAGEFIYFFKPPELSVEILSPRGKEATTDPKEIRAHLTEVKRALALLPEGEWTKEKIKEVLWKYATEGGRGNVLWPLRVALSGREKSPDPFTLSEILGKTETISRLDAAIALLSAA